MNPILIINAISALLSLKTDHTFDHLKGSITALVEQLRPTLPEKLDGTSWTDADVQAAKEAADLPWHMLKAIATPQADGDDGA